MQTPSLAAIEATRERLGDMILETPVWHWREPDIQDIVGPETQVILKLELFQRTGSFKPRGALAVMLDMDKTTLARGVTAVSAGNHAIAVAFAARFMGTSAKVVMPKTASPFLSIPRHAIAVPHANRVLVSGSCLPPATETTTCLVV